MAADVIAIRIPESRVNEGSAFTADVAFLTRSTAALTAPTSIKYRVDCVTTGTELTDWTSVSAASIASIAITPTHNAIQSDANEYEVKQITVTADDALTTQQRQAVQWRVMNLHGSP